MDFFESYFSNPEVKVGDFTMKYDQQDSLWYVTHGASILYRGHESACWLYINALARSN